MLFSGLFDAKDMPGKIELPDRQLRAVWTVDFIEKLRMEAESNYFKFSFILKKLGSRLLLTVKVLTLYLNRR